MNKLLENISVVIAISGIICTVIVITILYWVFHIEESLPYGVLAIAGIIFGFFITMIINMIKDKKDA